MSATGRYRELFPHGLEPFAVWAARQRREGSTLKLAELRQVYGAFEAVHKLMDLLSQGSDVLDNEAFEHTYENFGEARS